MPIQTCVIPAAGEGTRWLPLSGYIPKEMLPFGNKPAIEWVIKEAIESGCEQVIVVINKKKEIIKNYLLERSSIDRKKIYFTYQHKPMGIVDAFLTARRFIKDQPFSTIFPDNPALYTKPMLKQAIDAYFLAGPESYILSFSEYPKNNLLPYGECLLKKSSHHFYKVIHICPRPKIAGGVHHPGNKLHLNGRVVFPASALELFEKVTKDKKNDKPGDREVLELALKLRKPVIGHKVNGLVFDIGTPQTYSESYTRAFETGKRFVV